MRKSIPDPLKHFAKKLLFPVPSHLKKNHIQIGAQELEIIEQSIRTNFHTGQRSESNYSQEMYERALNAHLYKRLESDRREVIPWLDNACSLKDKQILEIGCGTGSSTVAMAEQGGKVTGIDIDKGSLLVAKDRCEVYGVKAEFLSLNADAILDKFGADRFDFVIFFASLEHLTLDERLTSLKQAWELLHTNGFLVIVETPNRLWYFDSHTSKLPFFQWLPDELAFQYSSFSPRENFNTSFMEYNPESREHFLRAGRGVSFHEFDLALKPVKELNVMSSTSSFEGIRYKLRKSKLERQFKSILMRAYPQIHQGFFDDYLYLIIQKDL